MLPIISGKELGIHNFKLLPIDSDSVANRIDTLGLHRHDIFQLLWIIAGSGTIQIDFQKYNYSSHTLSLTSPGQMHRLKVNESGATLNGYLLMFSKDMLTDSELGYINGASLSLFQLLGENPFYCINQEQVSFFSHIFNLLEREYKSEFEDRELVLRNYLNLILVELGRINHSWKGKHREEAALRLTKEYLNLVNVYYKTITSIPEYAALLHVTTNHLIESVKKTLDKTAGEVLRERQLLEAKRLLCYSNTPVSEIARQIGFQDPSYFGRMFKKNIGMSPTSFRKK